MSGKAPIIGEIRGARTERMLTEAGMFSLRMASATDGPPRTRPRILVVVDDDGVAEILRAALSAGGYAVATVRDPSAALELADVHPPAAIVVFGDARLPDGSRFADGWRRVMRAPATMIALTSAAPAYALAAVRRSLAES